MARVKYLYTFRDDGSTIDHGLVEVSDDDMVTEKGRKEVTPLEDFGNFLLTNEPVAEPYCVYLELHG